MSVARSAPAKPRPPAKSASPAISLPPVARTRAGHWIMLHALVIGAGVSVWAHGLLASLGFFGAPPEPRKRDDEGLRVVLVNAKHALGPKDAKLLAQNNLAGGGTTDAPALPTSPLPPEAREREGDALLETTQKRVQELEALQRELMSQARSNAAVELSRRQPERAQERPDDSQGSELTAQQRAIARQQAVVDKKLQEYAQRPRKQFIGATTKEYRFALYVDEWRQRMEKIGTLHYPREALTRPYSLLVSIEIKADGSVVNVDIPRSSGSRKIDDTARRIIQLASPFAPFPKDIRRDTDVLVVTRTWTFSGEQLRAEQ